MSVVNLCCHILFIYFLGNVFIEASRYIIFVQPSTSYINFNNELCIMNKCFISEHTQR